MAVGGFTAEDRQASILFRMSKEEKQRLKSEADELGITVQALLERRALGKYEPQRRRGGRQPKPINDEELPLQSAS